VKKSPPQTKARPTKKAVESLSTVQHPLSDSSQAEKAPTIATNPVPEQTPPPVVQPRLDARAGNNPPPDYPRAARKRGQEGTVVLSLVIGADGSVQDVSVERSSGYPLLDQSAVKAIRRWHFHPATQGGKAISWNYLQPIKFSLTD
jgi:protein TonB